MKKDNGFSRSALVTIVIVVVAAIALFFFFSNSRPLKERDLKIIPLQPTP